MPSIWLRPFGRSNAHNLVLGKHYESYGYHSVPWYSQNPESFGLFKSKLHDWQGRKWRIQYITNHDVTPTMPSETGNLLWHCLFRSFRANLCNSTVSWWIYISKYSPQLLDYSEWKMTDNWQNRVIWKVSHFTLLIRRWPLTLIVRCQIWLRPAWIVLFKGRLENRANYTLFIEPGRVEFFRSYYEQKAIFRINSHFIRYAILSDI